MTPLIRVEGRALPLPLSNVDTDLIIPAEHLKTVGRSGLGKYAFQTLRQKPVNLFDDPEWERSAPILIALDNFGCGSSREHAAWALLDLGIRVIIASSFSDIFAGNALRNGIATIELGRTQVRRLLAQAPGALFGVHLDLMRISSSLGDLFEFSMDSFQRECLMGGLDPLTLTLQHEAQIRAYETRTGI